MQTDYEWKQVKLPREKLIEPNRWKQIKFLTVDMHTATLAVLCPKGEAAVKLLPKGSGVV